MEVVINIPQKAYEQIVGFPQQTAGVDILILHKVLQEGKVLPAGHGRLIDADALETSYGLDCATKYGNESKEQQAHSYDTMMMYEIADMLDCAPTIIEADKAESDDKE